MNEIARRGEVELTFTTDELRDLFSYLAGCCLHTAQWAPPEVAEVLWADWRGCGGDAWQALPKDESESDSLVIVRLVDGTFGILAEGEDYTGHGCRCDSYTNRYATLTDLLNLGVLEADRAGIALALATALDGEVVEAEIVAAPERKALEA